MIISAKKFLKQHGNFLLISFASLLILCSVYKDVFRLFFHTHHNPHSYDFYQSYLAARALITGTELYGSGSGMYIYPPFYAFFLTSLAWTSEKVAHLAWLGLNVSLLILILFLGFRILASGFQLRLNRRQAAGACSLAVLLTGNQISIELAQGQSDLLVLAGFVLALYWLDRKPFLAGASLGVTALIKYQGLVFLPFLLFRARWRVIIGLLTGGSAAAFIPALMIGWTRNLNYLKIALRGIANIAGSNFLPVDYAAKVPKITWMGNVSITSGLTRIFRGIGWQKTDAFILVMILATFVFFFLRRLFQKYDIAFIWRTPQILGNPQQEKAIMTLEWCALLICLLIFSPQSTLRHTILLLNVNLLTAVMLLFPRHNSKRWPLLIATLIVQFGLWRYPFQRPHFYYESYVGLPGWSFLVFLPVFIHKGLAYYRNVYIAV